MSTNNLFLKFDQRRYENQINAISDIAKIYTDAANELLKLEVKGYKAENLINGGFMTVFDEYHKSQHDSPEWKKLGISYEKYLDLKELDTSRLKQLEENHQAQKDFKLELYNVNDLFFLRIKNRQFDNILNSKIMKLAPNKTTYKLFDLLKFKGNKAIINVPKKPYEFHALNKSQIDLLQDVTDFVNTARKLELEYNEIKPHVSRYLSDLSLDLKTINFDYLSILTRRI